MDLKRTKCETISEADFLTKLTLPTTSMCIEAEELARMHSHKFSLFLPMTTGSFICVILPVKTTLSHSLLLRFRHIGRNIQNGEVL